MYSSVNVCLECYFPDDWVEDLEHELNLADRFERYD